jgi:hypothetical protein
MRFLSNQCVVFTWRVSIFAWLRMDQLQGNEGRKKTEVLCPLEFRGSLSSQMPSAALFLWLSALCYCWWGCKQAKVKRNLCRHVQSEVLCLHVGPVTSRSLQVSDILWFLKLCFSFTNPDGNALREREENEKEKVVNCQGLSDSVASCSQRWTDRTLRHF